MPDGAQDLDTVGREDAYHYHLVRRAIELMDAEPGSSRSLSDIAAEMRMSPAHLQRVFSRWVGISPKRYQQYLALGHARALLHRRFSTLEAADSAGLSSGGRLHDLFLRWEAMSPGEYGRGGAGLTLRRGWFDGPFGRMLAMGTERGLCGLAFAEEVGEAAALDDLTRRWPQARQVDDPAALEPWVAAAFRGGEARLHLIGAPFQIKVWEALLRIPSGQVTTYATVAGVVGAPRAARAVGTAVGRNPVSWLIPCHRVLRGTGALGGYHWGLPVKRAMLAYESAREEVREGSPETARPKMARASGAAQH